MKRSEMIEKLCRPITLGDIELHLWPKEAEAILNRIEESGMHPPTVRDGAGGLAEYWEPEI